MIVAEEPTAKYEKLTVRLLPVPLQAAAPVELQETKVRLDGKLSVTTIV